jgi:hypothetical protein
LIDAVARLVVGGRKCRRIIVITVEIGWPTVVVVVRPVR